LKCGDFAAGYFDDQAVAGGIEHLRRIEECHIKWRLVALRGHQPRDLIGAENDRLGHRDAGERLEGGTDDVAVHLAPGSGKVAATSVLSSARANRDDDVMISAPAPLMSPRRLILRLMAVSSVRWFARVHVSSGRNRWQAAGDAGLR